MGSSTAVDGTTGRGGRVRGGRGGRVRGPRGGTKRGRLVHRLSGAAVAVGMVLLLGGFVLAAIDYRPFAVPTDSMDPTVAAGDRVIAERIDGGDVRRGDVVVFTDSVWGDVPMLKRVVGIGGDSVGCCDEQGRLTVNGTPIDEPYLKGRGPASPTGFESRVPKGGLFLLGDNRDVSTDSRTHLADDHGSVPRSAVMARVDGTAWPLGRMGMVERGRSFAAAGPVSEPGPLRWLVAACAAGALLILGGAAAGPVARFLGGRTGGRTGDRRGPRG